MAQDQGGDDFAAMLADFDQWSKDPEIGEKAEGTIIAISDDFAFVDLGAKSEGSVDRSELLDERGRLTVGVGDKISGLVAAVDESGNLILRVRAGRGEAMREEIELAWKQQLPVDGLVAEVIKGGVEVTVGGLRAFCPVSQLDTRYVEDPEVYVGQRFEFRIVQFDNAGRRPNIVVSRKALLQEEERRRADALREYLEVGAVMEGKVTSLTSYGAFVDLGGLEGLLHASEISHRRGVDPSEELHEGQVVEVLIQAIEPPKKEGQTERISLSMKALGRDPWESAARRYPKDRQVSGRVMSLEAYGAFVELEPGLEGLAHISRLGGKGNERHARQIVELGQNLEVTVLEVDVEKKRISLARTVDGESSQERREVDAYLKADAKAAGEGFGSLAALFEKKRLG